MATIDCTDINSRRIFVTDQNSKIQFLIDTGADLCVYPRTMISGQREKSSYELSAANNTVIATYLILHLKL